MGGMSFRCPECKDFWSLDKRALKGHLRDKHGITGVRVEGVGPSITLVPNHVGKKSKQESSK